MGSGRRVGEREVTKEVVGDAAAVLSKRDLVGGDVEAVVNLHFVGVDDLCRAEEAGSEVDREAGLTGAEAGARDDDELVYVGTREVAKDVVGDGAAVSKKDLVGGDVGVDNLRRGEEAGGEVDVEARLTEASCAHDDDELVSVGMGGGEKAEEIIGGSHESGVGGGG